MPNEPSDLEALKSEYQEVKAPNYLASKIIANIEQESELKTHWFGVSAQPLFSGAFALAIISLFVLVTPDERQLNEDVKYSAIPSISDAAKVLAQKPRMKMPSLSSVGGMSTHVATPSQQNLQRIKLEAPMKKSNWNELRKNDSQPKKPTEDTGDESIKRFI